MPRIPIFGVPEYLQDVWNRWLRQSLANMLWKTFLTGVGVTVIYLMISSGGFFLSFAAGTILSAWLADDIIKLARDIWNRNWAEVKLNLS